ncbi:MULTISPECIES: chromosome segregation protein SMC [Thalassolituus]|uniref:chromosome segregation protein SMC n=1 Tax=Thalassolituus TaxID=187492 RepID=UPI000C609035|nr:MULTISPECIES: chromosome segregation protein SMC [Thalassolituus]MAX87148.1 chromosome segregation protein SMC [Oceanospirillaceae bacterium]|tara:strand:- start:11270 stop:14779 length:3510 start_codon:yes stop_codon:yes gene_type:complete
MRLKAIRLSGFKSFVDPTSVPFNTNLTGIVGPNGCGKSNTIDAVRWVMGESSAKYLRGDAMTDVIFNGSAERKPVSKASVDLVFDNSDGTLKGEHAKFSEISVRRQVTRDGQSTYYLNGTKCRRKDITDIFLGTGLGPRSYAIIEQGMISRLIEAKPEELRVYVEEAAGISKYKDRRRETENRMRRTQENLERLSDIRDELERQLAHLQRQAQAAEKYKELKAEERQKKAELLAIRWTALNEEYEQREKVIREHEVQFEAHMAKQRAADAGIEELRLDHQARTDAFSTAQGKYYEVGNRIARQEQKIEHQSQLALQLDSDLAEVEKNILDTQRQLEQDQLQQEELAEQRLMLEPEVEMLQAAEEEHAAELLEAEEAQRQWQSQWDAFTQRASEPTRRADVAQSRIQATEQQVLRLEQQIERLKQERQQLTSDPDLGDFALLQEEVSEAELQAEEQQARLEEIRGQLEDVREDSERRRKELEEGRQRLQQMLGRKATLEALQKAALGQSSEGVTHWLESHQLARKPRLAQQLTVAEGWETAVETVLGDYLQAVVVDDVNAAEPWLSGFADGTLTLWESTVNSGGAAAAGLLLDKLTTDQNLSSLMGKVRIAETLPEAMAMRSQLAQDESVITPDGIWLGPAWLRVARDQDNEGGILARQQELELIDAEADELDISVEEWEADLESVLLRQRSLEQQRDNAQQEWQMISRKLMEQKASLSGQQAKAEQLRLRTEKIEQSLNETEETRTLESEALAELRLEWQEAMSAVDEDTDERERLQQSRSEVEQRLSQARMAAGQQKDRLHQLQLQLQALNSRDESTRHAISRLAEAMQKLKERRDQINVNQNRDHSADLELLRAEMEALQEEKLQAEEVMTEARHALEQADTRLRQLEQERSEAEQQALAERNKLEQIRMECQALDIRRNGLVDQLREDKLSMADVLDSLPEAANEEQWANELTRIGERIQRLGAINLAAIEEYKLQSERKVYLDSQNDDLEKALDTLEGAIRKIDAETRNRFQETFDRMNAGLADLFPKVFGGGHASLELTTDDLLTTGVAIMARPPGKKNSTIHLLSGGEKALTAIALVFSIFQLNPAPFCMLDEVDAPLDDANVGRYARLVKAMSEKVQFIYITHNKIAMEMADQLMGVTMHEPGVSRLVSVDVEEAAVMVENG